jgi:hypothetical protein
MSMPGTPLALRLLKALGLPEVVHSFTLVLGHKFMRATVRPAAPSAVGAEPQGFELGHQALEGAHWPLANALCRELGLPEHVSRIELRFAAGAISEVIVDVQLLHDVDADDIEQACSGLRMGRLVPVTLREAYDLPAGQMAELSPGQRAFIKGAVSSIR